MWETHSESVHGHCLGGLCFQVCNLRRWLDFADLLLAVIKQRCIAASAPFWIGGELPIFVVRHHATNMVRTLSKVCTVTVRYEYMYRATPIFNASLSFYIKLNQVNFVWKHNLLLLFWFLNFSVCLTKIQVNDLFVDLKPSDLYLRLLSRSDE